MHDVVIVGAGVTGLAAAEQLSEHHSVLVLEASDIPGGASAACVGLLVDSVEEDLIDMLEHRHAPAVISFVREGIQGLINVVQKHKLACDLRSCNSIYLAENEEQAAIVRDEHATRHDHKETVSLLGVAVRDRLPVAGVEGMAGRGFTIDAQKLCREWAKALARKRVEFRTGVRVLKIRNNTLITTAGPVPFTKVILTGAAASMSGLTLLPVRTFALRTAPLSPAQQRRWPKGDCFWTAEDPPLYHYAKINPDQSITFGGNDLLGASSVGHAYMQRKLRDDLQRIIRLELEISRAWSGTILVSPDGLPQLDVNDNIYVAAGAPGLPFAYSAGTAIAKAIDGEPISAAFGKRAFSALERMQMAGRHRPVAAFANAVVILKSMMTHSADS